MNQVQHLAAEITSRYGTIKRARNCFLYTAKGVRLTDMFLESGRAILGWGGSSAFTMLKNVLGRGITGSFDTDFTPRAEGGKSQLSRAVSELLASERDIYLFTSKQTALKTALETAPESTSLYKPWAESANWSDVSAVIIEPPLAWTPAYWILAVKTGTTVPAESAPIAAPLCAAITRSIYNLIAALQEREEKDWFIYDTVLTKYWTRKGPYLYPKMPQEVYALFVQHCLEQEIVISPVYEQPSIVPFGADKGVFRKLERNPFTWK
ncbi:MAG: hypothetical protein IJS09_01725 [Treponema sp.]|nr:hypothetical protein [Treponema sp.]